MNSIRRIICVLSSTVITLVFAQGPDTLWTRTYDLSANDIGFSVKQTSDGGFIIGGCTGSDGFLIKTDSNGNIQWTETYDGRIFSVCQTYDNGYITTGQKTQAYFGEIFVMRTDSLGDILWTRVVVTSNWGSYAREIQPASDDCYVVIGTATKIHSLDFYENPRLLKIDVHNNLLWCRGYGAYYSHEFGQSVQQTYDGGFILGVFLNFRTTLIKTDTSGIMLWMNTYWGIQSFPHSVIQEYNGGYVVTGGTPAFIMRTDSLGDSLWAYDWGVSGHEHGECVRETPDGNYIVAGYTDLFSNGLYDVYLLKFDDDGNNLWTRTYGGDSADVANEIEVTTDGGYIVVGYTRSFGAGGNDVWLLRLATDQGIEERKTTNLRWNVTGTAIINGPLILPEDKKCRVLDITGRTVLPVNLQSGIYFIEMDGEIRQKVIKIQ